MPEKIFATITGTVARRERFSVDVPRTLWTRVAGFMRAWHMDTDQFVDAVTENGKRQLTIENIEQMLSTR
ncbi:MAG TPA: hypothetical protein VJ553_00775 [Candidatus Paceibacterota bacterium]|nr:hypothetical protein [Candidatus Paceibacterota bacterium]